MNNTSCYLLKRHSILNLCLKTVVSQPEDLVLESAGVSWIVLSWSLTPGDILITAQIIFVSGGGTERNITLDGSGTSFNVTDLQPGTEYSFRVIAVASDGQTSIPSLSFTAATAEIEGDCLPTETKGQ